MKNNKLRFSENIGNQLFIPSIYEFSDRRDLLNYVADNPFAQLFSAENQLLQTTSTPLILDADSPPHSHDELVFLGHIAKRNPHCRAIENRSDALAVFSGADAYISPRWFKNANTVPTWSFISVHLRGRFEPITAQQETLDILLKTITHMEHKLKLSGDRKPWSLEETPQELVDMLQQHILAFRFLAHSIEGVSRLNQEKDNDDRLSIIQGLMRSPQRGATEIARLISSEMMGTF